MLVVSAVAWVAMWCVAIATGWRDPIVVVLFVLGFPFVAAQGVSWVRARRRKPPRG